MESLKLFIVQQTKKAAIKVTQALNVQIGPGDIDVSHKLHGGGEKPIIVKSNSHKTRLRLYKQIIALKNIKVSDILPMASPGARREERNIY